MRKKNYFLNYGRRASSEEMAHLAINPGWSCNPPAPKLTRQTRRFGWCFLVNSFNHLWRMTLTSRKKAEALK